MTIGEEAVVDGNIISSNSKNAAPQISVTKDIEVFVYENIRPQNLRFQVAKKAKLNRNIVGGSNGSTIENEHARDPVKHPEYAPGKLLVLYINVESNEMPKKVRSGTKKV